MRNPERIDEIMNVLKRIWKTYPDFRLGQLIENAMGDIAFDMYHVEDDVILEQLLKYEKRIT